MTKFGETLKRIRTEKNMNQEELAQKMEMTQAAISQFEKGLRVPTPAKVKQFAEVLGVLNDDFFPDPEQERKSLMRKINQMNPQEIKDLDKFARYLISEKQNNKQEENDAV
jgi:transcriptional regulator with XRE-family HTH domain